MSVNPKGHKCTIQGIYNLAKANNYPGALDEFTEQLIENINNGVDINTSTVGQYLNLKNYQNSEEVLAATDALTRTLSEKLYNRTVVTNQMTNEKAEKLLTQTVSSLADLTGQDKGTLLSRVVRDVNNLQQATVDTVAIKGSIEAIAGELLENAKGAARLDPESLQRQEALRDALLKLVAADRPLGAESGRLLQARQATTTPVSDVVELIAKNEGNPVALAEALSLARSKHGVIKLIKGGVDAVMTYRINAMLSGPITQGINMGSNAFKTILSPAERMFGGALSGQKDQVRQGWAMYQGLLASFGDAVQLAGAALKTNQPILRGTSSTVETLSRDISAESFDLNPDSIVGQGVNWLGKIVGLPTRLLMSGDEFWLQLNYRGRLRTELAEKASKAGLSPGTAEYDKFIQENFEGSFHPNGRAANDDALLYATQQNYSQDLKSNDTWISEAGAHVQKLHNSKNPGLRILAHLVTPFVRTPVNILEDIINHTPGINLLHPTIYKDYHAGGERRANAIGKVVTGSAFYGLGLAVASQGGITGQGPSDPKLRKSMMEMGWKPYSFVFNKPDGTKEYFQLSRFDPLGSYLGTAADLFEAAEHMQSHEFDRALSILTASIAAQMENKTFVQGLVDASTALTKLTHGELDEKFFNSLAGSWVPSLATTFKNDPNVREVNSILDAVRNRIPGQSKDLPIKRNFLGEAVPPAAWGLWTKQDNSPVTQEFLNLVEKGVEFSELPQKLGNVDLNTFRAANGDTAYERFGELLSTSKIDGKTLKETLAELITHPEYQKAGDPYRDTNGEYAGGKVQYIKEVLAGYRAQARELLQTERFTDAKGRDLANALARDEVARKATSPQERQAMEEELFGDAPQETPEASDTGLQDYLNSLQEDLQE